MSKEIYDEIHGYITLSLLALKFCDTLEFQRLAYIKQLGVSSFVFPCADHTRKAHSFGCYHLCTKFVERLKYLFPFEVEDRDIDLIPVAGLLHDIGHGPYSHVFDTYLSKIGINSHHEERSAIIIRSMIQKYNIDLSENDITFIIEMINPPKNKKLDWRYQIVSGVIDADRMDYIVRDSRNVGIGLPFNIHNVNRIIDHCTIKNRKLAFENKVARDIEGMLEARSTLHEIVYQHKASICIEQMLIKFMLLADPKQEWINKVIKGDLTTFCHLSDATLLYIHDNPEIPKEASDIIQQIWDRKLYKVISQNDYASQDLDNEKSKKGQILVKKWVGKDVGNTHPLNNVEFTKPTPFKTNDKYRVWRVLRISTNINEEKI